MNWILLSLVYAITNAVYITFNEKRGFNGYVLGIWRGFGIAALVAPLLLTVPMPTSAAYYLILILQGLMIGVYDSHIFFASAKYGGNASSGFMATSVLTTVFLWWGIEFQDLASLMHHKGQLVTLMFILCGFSISYWKMMHVHVNREAEGYLYPAVFALALMSIATKYIALNGGSVYVGVVYYLAVACFVSGVYNTVMFIRQKLPKPPAMANSGSQQGTIPPPSATAALTHLPPHSFAAKYPKLSLLLQPVFHWQGVWLIAFSTILITAKTLALRIAENPGYVVAMLLLSPMFADIIQKKQIIITQASFYVIFFLVLLLLLVS